MSPVEAVQPHPADFKPRVGDNPARLKKRPADSNRDIGLSEGLMDRASRNGRLDRSSTAASSVGTCVQRAFILKQPSVATPSLRGQRSEIKACHPMFFVTREMLWIGQPRSP